MLTAQQTYVFRYPIFPRNRSGVDATPPSPLATHHSPLISIRLRVYSCTQDEDTNEWEVTGRDLNNGQFRVLALSMMTEIEAAYPCVEAAQ